MGGSALVIGAGIGGLATAVRLRHAGWNVTVLEKNVTPGGRCNVWRQDGFTFDTGPTLLLMRDVLDTLFTTVGHNLDDYMDLIRLTPNYRVHFGNGAGVEFSSDYPRMEAELETIERGSAQAFRRYLAPQLLIVDDFGLHRLSSQQSGDWYELIIERHRRSSFVVTANRAVDEWLALFDDPILGNSALDRLANGAHQLVIEGPSYRAKLAPKRRDRGAVAPEYDTIKSPDPSTEDPR